MSICSQHTPSHMNSAASRRTRGVSQAVSGYKFGINMRQEQTAAALLTRPIALKSRCLGQAWGLCEAANDTSFSFMSAGKGKGSHGAENEAFLRLSDKVATSLRKVGTSEQEDLNSLTHFAVALIIRCRRSSNTTEKTKDAVNSKLITSLCWCGARDLSVGTLEAAVPAWRWLLSAIPSLRAEVVTQLCAAWGATVNKRQGMFAEYTSVALRNTTAASLPPRKEVSLHEAQLMAHTVWIMFMCEVRALYLSNQEGVLAMLWFAFRSMSDAVVPTMSRHPLALPCRFRLLHLCLSLAKELELLPDAVPKFSPSMLHNKVVNSALQWFECAPQWSEYHFDQPTGDAHTNAQLDNIETLCHFAGQLAELTKVAMLSPLVSRGGSMDYIRGDTSPVDNQPSSPRHQSGDRISRNSIVGSPLAMENRRSINAHNTARSRFFTETDICELQDRENQSPDGHQWPLTLPPSISTGLPSQYTNQKPRSESVPTQQDNQPQPFGSALLPIHDAAKLVLLLISHEVESMAVWCQPATAPSAKYWGEFSAKYTTANQWQDLVAIAWKISPKVFVSLCLRYMVFRPLVPGIVTVMRTDSDAFMRGIMDNPDAVQFFALDQRITHVASSLHLLAYFSPAHIHDALHMLKHYPQHLTVVQYAVRSLQSYPPEEVLEFMPQLIQSLRYDSTKMVEKYLLSTSLISPIVAHRLVWLILAEGKDPDEKPKEKVAPKPDEFLEMIEGLRESVIKSFDPPSKKLYLNEFEFFDKVNAISGVLFSVGEGQDRVTRDEARKAKIKQELLKIDTVPPNVYLPTSHESKVIGIDTNSGVPLQSAAKVPILISFKIAGADTNQTTHEHDGALSKFPKHMPKLPGKRRRKQNTSRDFNNDARMQGCIFKVGDDCRQDQLALQMIRCFRNAFQKAGLDLYVYPYNVVSTKPGCGVIELVPNTKSLDQLGKAQENFLYDYFIQTFGSEDQLKFQAARRNFIKSMAAYSIISYILQIKDRHNGNILLDSAGHVVHIDFGFIFEISPGHDMGFEKAPFKLTGEMIHVMGDLQSESYQLFRQLCLKGYLVIRRHMNEILAIAELMAESGLGCFKTSQTIQALASRFRPKDSERQASEHLFALVNKSESHITTHIYDWVQAKQNDIAY